jgi:hypothetical protein
MTTAPGGCTGGGGARSGHSRPVRTPQDDTADPAAFVWPPDNGENFGINGRTDLAYAMFAAEAVWLRGKNGPATVAVDDAAPGRWTSSEGWTHCTACDEPDSAAAYHQASQSWSATLGFAGTRVTYRGVTASYHGIAAVSVDSDPRR